MVQAAYLWRMITMAILSLGIAIPCYADDAPVYEVDNYPPPFDTQSDATTYYEQNTSSPILSRDQRIGRLEQQLKNLQNSEGASKIEVLQKEVQLLRGQVEELTHQLQLTKTQQQAMYADLDKRIPNQTLQNKTHLAVNENEPLPKNVSEQPRDTISQKSSKPVSTDISKIKSIANANPPSELDIAEEQKIYQTAYDLIKSKKYNEAVNTLKKMLERYPSGQSAANAHYWLGELYSLLNKNDLSAIEFTTVVKKYPKSSKVSDAELKLGLIYAGQFKWPEAKNSFKKVINRYPGTASARVATEQLKQIKQAGH